MEVVTTTAGAAATNNHNHSHFHHNDQQRMPPHHTHNGISVGLICTNGNGSAGDGDGGERSPFQREVREWQRIDPDTGALLTGRLEADRWINGPMNKYGKISDSQNITQPNGTQHTQRKQLEVLQARTATGGAMQVIRTQTVQKTSSRWSSSTSNSTTASASSPSSVMASPTITGALTMNGKVNSFSNNAHKSSSHSNRLHSRFNQPKSSSLEITEVSSHSHSSSSRCSSDVDDAFDNDDDDDITENGLINGSNHFSNRHSFPYNSKNKIDSSNISLLLETAPSLKLSNLMKSNSSLSSNGNSSSSSNSTTASTISNLNNKKSAVGKISLHSIVGDVENTNRRTTTVTSASTSFPSSSSTLSSLSSPLTSSLTTMAATSATNWQQHSSRRFEQPTLYGKDSQCQSLTKSRVGVNVAEAGAGNGYGDAVSDVGDGGGGGGVVDNLTPTQLKSRQQRQDLESFRHCTEQLRTSTSTSASASASSLAPTTTSPFFADCANDDDEVLCLNKTHQIRQHNPCSSETATQLQRSRSISIDDLSTEWEKNSEKNNEESGEWRRVSKLRRSFQSSTNSKVDNSTQQRKPIDLPSNSVSVARIRAELENGRRLNTAMRNNHIDLAALDTILNGSTMESRDLKSIPTQRSNFLTAESLKEIRAGLKKLSDESLYRDDFAPSISNATAPDEHIEIQDVKKPPERVRLHQLSPKKPTEITPPKSAFQVFTRTVTPPNGSPTTNGSSFATQYSLPNGCVQKPNTRSLESRQKNRESTASIDWHLRRKSYGFEKMTPPDDKSMFRMDASTDSGLGRSGEQLGNWSPTESGNSSNLKTVIHFGETPKVVANTTTPKVFKRYNAPTQTTESIDSDLKRHSIAVDESLYVRDNVRKTSQVHLPGYYDSSIEAAPSSLQPVRSAVQQKRVEFCKTEVHFAAESGRVNIVETDGKPPPTNNFRRRRRTTSGQMQTLMTTSDSAINKTDNVTLFGEDNQTKILASSTVAYKASLVDSPSENVLAATSVTCSIPKAIGNVSTRSSSSSTTTTTNRYASTNVVVDSADGGDVMDEISAIRGILKNKPIKPKPYHLGENIDSADALWGVQLKPVGGIVKNELTKSTSPPSIAASSVAERIRIVEKRQENPSVTQTNGYSTKINLSLGDEPRIWTDAELPKTNVMNIELHSPQMSLERNSAAKIKQTIPPVAKPRTVLSANVVEIPTNNNVKTPDNNRTEKRDATNRDILKIVKETRGARKLREHELSYFGVQVPKDSDDNKETRPKSSYPNIQTKSPKRTLPQRKTNDNQHAEMIQETTTPSIKTNWQLLNDDKPDLLRHSSIAVEPKPSTRTAEVKPMERQSLKNLSDDDDYDEHIYENIVTDMKPVFKVQSPTRMLKDYDEQRESYNRKTDLKRDAFILSEMTENADETLKAISDEAAIKDQRRRSLQRRRTKPLETIDEKTIAEKINDKCIAVKVTRSTLASEAKRNARYISSSPTKLSSRARSSSISSNEGCSCARSRSLSSEHEYENIRIRPKRISKSATRAKDTRSSSQDSHRALKTNYCSSGDDDVHARTVKLIPRSDVRKHSSKQDALRQRDKVQRSSKEKSQRHSDEHKKRTSSSTAHSSRKERVECNDEDKKRHHRNHHHHLNSTDSSSARKAKDPKSYSSSRNIPIDKKEKERSHSSSTRAVEHTHSSGRSERDSGRDKTARSKAYFSRSKNERISSTSHASHEKHRTATPTNLSENKKSTTISKQHDAKQREPSMSTTNGKTTPLINDHQREHHQHHQHHATLQNGNHENHHLHSMTTATIAAKHRENRSGKDRK